MNKNLRFPIKFGVLVSAIVLMNIVAYGATFTAVASGNWSNPLTWGGAVPSTTNAADQITIPIGINVAMDNNVTFTGATAQVSVFGTLSSLPNITFKVITGTINGTGVITTDSLWLGAGSVLLFTGSITTNTLKCSAPGLQSSSIILVNQTLDLSSGTFNVIAGGSLTMGNNTDIVMSGGILNINGGTLTLTNNYSVTYKSSSATSGPELSGMGLQNVTINVGNVNSVSLSNNLTVNGILTITSGSLILSAHDLAVTGNIGIGAGAITSTIASNISLSGANNMVGVLLFNGMASGVNNLTINMSNGAYASISGALTINGVLTLTSGELNIVSSAFIITGDIAATGTGTLSPNMNSNISVNTSTAPSGILRFTNGNTTFHNLSINIGNGSSLVTSHNLIITGILTLTAGHINIGNDTLSMGSSATIVGANSNAYIITGTTGCLAMPLIAGALNASTFPIGTATSYFPASVKLNTGSTSGLVRIGVMPNVLANGTSGNDISISEHLVDATWNLSSTIVTNLNLNVQLMWDPSSEVNGFVRGTSYISHYTGSTWDTNTKVAATAVAGGMFSLSRNNLTSLSPFAVFDNTTSTGVIDINNMAVIEIYPNPSAENISIVGIIPSDGVVNMEIRNINGQLMRSEVLVNSNNKLSIKELPVGNYFIQLHNNKTNTVKRFIKI